jgi:hypothetical protein
MKIMTTAVSAPMGTGHPNEGSWIKSVEKEVSDEGSKGKRVKESRAKGKEEKDKKKP